jgi:hypothetical protein
MEPGSFLLATSKVCVMMPSSMSCSRAPGAVMLCKFDDIFLVMGHRLKFLFLASVTFKEKQMFDLSRSVRKVFVANLHPGEVGGSHEGGCHQGVDLFLFLVWKCLCQVV